MGHTWRAEGEHAKDEESAADAQTLAVADPQTEP